MSEMKQVIAPSSTAAIRLAQLAGFNADLAEALNGFTIALHLIESKETWEQNLVRPLVSDATVSYGRCFTSSNVRPNLETIIDVPDSHADVHHALKRLRNRTVAHSESTLTPSYAVANLERDESAGTIRASQALAITAHVSFSMEAIQQFHELTLVVKELLLHEIEKAKAELLTVLNDGGDLQELWDSGLLPQLVPVPLEQWDVDSKRADYPDSHIIPVVVTPARTFLAPSSGNLFEPPAP
ncbi:hypothetical protein [Microbacterium sp.]|uniref:hypothetical protein n=1 Tax=Microbacterium sp. TaxID=51671 RepID=UPI001ACBD47F|nr:hypothetical protein [Microbacterium sp.]MBN9159218.1 hypothetical protein [Microbacterium sp.]